MSAVVIDGNRLSRERIDWLRVEIERRGRRGLRRPGLAVVVVGSDPASRIYVRNKRRACKRAGIVARDHDLPESTSQAELLALIERLNADPEIDGVLVQLPLPAHIDPAAVTNAIDPYKDVDGFHAENIGRLVLRQPGLRPCTAVGIMTMLRSIDMAFKGAHAVVVGASNHVGRPLLMELLLAGSTVTCCHKFTVDLRSHVAAADILLVAVGKPGLIPGAWIKPGAVVIDVGINRLEDGSLCGDVEFDAARERAAFISPVPGGVGPMTVAGLLENTFQAVLAAEERGR